MSNLFSGLSGYPVGPRTPEPTGFAAPDDAHPPSPPRPRLRLKRRVGLPHLSAPTQNFLASVAAASVPVPVADVPIPSIEEPESLSAFPPFPLDDEPPSSQAQAQPPLRFQLQLPQSAEQDDDNFLRVRGRCAFSPPKTPAPGAQPSDEPPSRYPNWSMESVFSSSSAESSPDREFSSCSRPSTARSTQTSSSSLFSRFSQLSDEDHCGSPEEDAFRNFTFPPKPSSDDHDHRLEPFPAITTNTSSSATRGTAARALRSDRARHPRKAPWTRAMSAHLWATYTLYLQDPKVTPFRVGKGCVPPDGVCLRVAREAKRSWKGARAVAKTSVVHAGAAADAEPAAVSAVAAVSATSNKSGSSTPTAADNTTSSASGTFMEWPHTNAATRAHLRDLCRQKASMPGSGARDGMQYMSRSPTPFTHATVRLRNLRAAAPGQSRDSAFATRDMAVSLSVSTSDAMQPQGPLAQLTRSAVPDNRRYTLPNGTAAAQELAERLSLAMEADEPSSPERRRLGSPFGARSYGPSSSSSLAAVLGLSTSASAARQSHTMGTRRSLQSPVRFSRAGTQKRRSKTVGQDSRKRPILGLDLFTDPLDATADFSSSASSSALPSAAASYRDTLFSSSRALHGSDDFFAPRHEFMSGLASSYSAPSLIPASPPPANSTRAKGRAFTSTSSSSSAGSARRPQLAPGVLASTAPLQPPARLGSPFCTAPNTASTAPTTTSFSFPNRYSQPSGFDLGSLGRQRQYATVQRVTETARPAPARTDLAARLAYLDQRLREINKTD